MSAALLCAVLGGAIVIMCADGGDVAGEEREDFACPHGTGCCCTVALRPGPDGFDGWDMCGLTGAG